VAVTSRDRLHFTGSEMLDIDKRLAALVKDSPLELADVATDRGTASYFMFHRQAFETKKDGKWKWGFVLTFSALGDAVHPMASVVKRCSDSGMAILPRAYSHESDVSEPGMDERWSAVESFIMNPPDPLWATLDSFISKSISAPASFREVREARTKLGKLKVDKEDNETLDRINTLLQMKRITKEYAVKDLPFTPSRLWYCRASTPLHRLFLAGAVMREAASAPSFVPYEIRKSLYLHAGSLLAGTPDLCPEQNPPAIDWDRD
jgi:hypothetical protein